MTIPMIDTARQKDTAQQGRAEPEAARWTTPDYQVIETSLEVTAYFGAES
jgi:coenzyme PQQ precursor peptide PqqA